MRWQAERKALWNGLATANREPANNIDSPTDYSDITDKKVIGFFPIRMTEAGSVQSEGRGTVEW